MDWLVLAVLAIVARALMGIFHKTLTNAIKLSPVSLTFVFFLVSGVLAIFAIPFFGGISVSDFTDHWQQMLILAAAQTFGAVIYFNAVKRLDAGTAQITFTSILIWAVLLSIIFLDSSFNLLQLAGVLVMVLAILLTQYQGKLVLNSAILTMLVAAALFGIFQVFSADLADLITPASYLILTRFGPISLLLIFYHRKILTDLKTFDWRHSGVIKAISASTVVSLAFFIFTFYAYREAPDPGVVVILQTSQVVLAVILGIIFLKERDNIPKKLAAGVLAFIAGILINN